MFPYPFLSFCFGIRRKEIEGKKEKKIQKKKRGGEKKKSKQKKNQKQKKRKKIFFNLKIPTRSPIKGIGSFL